LKLFISFINFYDLLAFHQVRTPSHAAFNFWQDIKWGDRSTVGRQCVHSAVLLCNSISIVQLMKHLYKNLQYTKSTKQFWKIVC